MDGHCHCGAVTLRVPGPPAAITDCNCSICRRYGVLWAYWPREAVTVTGPTAAYAWGRGALAFHHCPTCGCVSHWSGLRDDIRRVGVNVRLLDGFPFPGVQVEALDGASDDD